MKVWIVMFGVLCAIANGQDAVKLRAERDGMVKKGLWREVVDQYGGDLGGVVDGKSGDDLEAATRALGELGAWAEFDQLIENAVTRQLGNPVFLIEAAERYRDVSHGGRMVGGGFERGGGGAMPMRRGGLVAPAVAGGGDDAGEAVLVLERDRVRGIQLALQAVEAAGDDKIRSEAWRMAGSLIKIGREGGAAWKLQVRTALENLPDWREQGPQGGTEGAPWRGDTPVLHEVPRSWQAAASDGERWRWALAERARLGSDSGRAAVLLELAAVSHGQFGVGSLAGFGWWRSLDPEAAKGLVEVDTLGDDECLAKTSDGVKRFKLPADQHFIAIYQKVAAGEAGAEQALGRLVQIHLDRRQRDRAAEVLGEKIRRFKPKKDHSDRELLAQITGNWGSFETVPSFPAGTRPELPFIYRNAKSVTLSAAPIDMTRVLRDLRSYLEGNPRELERRRIDPAMIGWRIVRENEDKYLGKARQWKLELDPREKHRDSRAMIEVPVDSAGAWLVTARLPEGNSSRIVAWINDTALLKRQLGKGLQWWVADAVTGAPVGGAEVEFFGYRTERLERKLASGRRMNVHTRAFKRTADADGRVMLPWNEKDRNCSWLALARHEGRRAFHGFGGFGWHSSGGDRLDQSVMFGASDRPLYQAGDEAQVKFWLRKVAYDFDGKSEFAGGGCRLVVRDGTGQQVVERKDLRLDEWGGIDVGFEIPGDARLGQWNAQLFMTDGKQRGAVSFRVEEYRKPEYEVTVDAPERPVRLGDSFDALVRARYFHGAPVSEASVRVKVKRSAVSERWFPNWRWDWLYGPGAWWPMAEAAWHPRWDAWCCHLPLPPWAGGRRWTPEELVMEKTLPIGADGTAKVTVDTAVAKQIHGDLDARYTIEAEVVDASRRSESGSGTVTAARRPFEVAVWLDRGWARPGDAATAEWSAATLDGVVVKRARGMLKLYRITGLDAEEEVRSWEIATDDEGRGRHEFELPEEGQYRLAATLAAAGDDEIVEGATVVGVHGRGKGGEFHFGPLEIVADKMSYRAGETARLRVQSDREDASVWLFLRVEGQDAREARRIDLANGSAEIEVPLDLADMPNVFVEGVTVHGGGMHTAVRQLLLPPETRVLGVDLDAPKRVEPRAKSRLVVRVTDAAGKPFAGTAAITVYDKALEAIVGGSNVPPIAERFWSWRRYYSGAAVSDSLSRLWGNHLGAEKEKSMRRLGRFGDDAVTRRGRGLGAGWGGGGGNEVYFGTRVDSLAMDAGMPAPATAMVGRMAAAGPAIVVRKDFADLVKWAGEVEVGADGIAELPVEFPDNLTTWVAKVWVLGEGTRVGEGEAEIVSSKDLLVRLQAPRFLVERDEAVLSAIVHNYHDRAKKVVVSLETPGGLLERVSGEDRSLRIEAGGEARVEWRVRALSEGEAMLRMTARTGDGGDAVERKLPVVVHGMLRQDAWSRVIDPGAEQTTIGFEVPEKRRPAQTKLTVRVSPTVAGAVVDAIPYLAEYPHGCTEQTLNRFVPAVIARKMLADLGIDLESLRAKRANLNPQELGDPAQRAEQWRQWDRNPVFDPVELDRMVAAGLERLAQMQNGDGGWGWFSGWGERSYPHTTAVVVHGLISARAAGAEVDEGMLKRGLGWLGSREKTQLRKLERHLREMKKPEKRRRFRDCKSRADATDALVRRVLGEGGRDGRQMLGFLFRDRLELPLYAQCLLGLELHRAGEAGKRDDCLATIEQFRKDDAENQTSFLELPNRGYWWVWYGSEIETHTWYLQLLNAVKPQAPETRGLVKYLVNNRAHGSWWDSTRDTAYAVEAIAGFLKASGEDRSEMEIDVRVDGKLLRTVHVTPENMFTIDNTIVVAGDALAAGGHEIEIIRRGKGPVYANAYLEVFSLEDRLRAAGLEVKVARMMRKLSPDEGTTAVPDAVGLVSEQRVEAFKRSDLVDGAELGSGELIEVELIIESKNDYEYLLFEDWKPAGFEALRALSGYLPGPLSAYMEPRDEKVTFFVRSLPRGTHSIKYRLRAETPGVYHALPARAEAMYAPELRGNSDEMRVGVR